MRVRRIARAHADELGAVLAVHRGGPGAGTALAIIAVWALFSGLTLIRPAGSIALILATPIAFGIIATLIWVMLSGERLVVCERGLLVGSVAPGLTPYLVRLDQITPRSVVPVGRARRWFRETGSSVSSTARLGWWSSEAVALVGPSPREARRRRAILAPLLDPAPSTIDGRWAWIIGVRGPAARVTQEIAGAAGGCGLTDLARRTAAAPRRELTGRAEDAAEQIPGQGPVRRPPA